MGPLISLTHSGTIGLYHGGGDLWRRPAPPQTDDGVNFVIQIFAVTHYKNGESDEKPRTSFFKESNHERLCRNSNR
jgi:hypothetical protein